MLRLLLFALALLIAAPAGAQTLLLPYAGFDTETEELVGGVAAQFGMRVAPTLDLALHTGVEATFTDPTFVQIDADAVVRFGAGVAPIRAWAGGGLAVGIFETFPGDSDTELGFSALAGAAFGRGFITPFAQVRYTAYDDFVDTFTIMGGAAIELR